MTWRTGAASGEGMDTISLIALLLTLSAGFSILNHHIFRLPVTIGVLV
ncbi:MAG: sodium:proton antiporter, partial [Acetobacter sp.]|nr:sodium:proton antiporter [Acetobacter sp.]